MKTGWVPIEDADELKALVTAVSRYRRPGGGPVSNGWERLMGQSRETSAHWGSCLVEVDGDGLTARPHPDDPDASPAIGNVDAYRHRSRVTRPAVRRRRLENGPGPDGRRGDPGDEHVEVDWNTVLDLVAGELRRVRAEHGPSAVFGGSYGWGSAGRLHHAQSQLHRFLSVTGGCTRSVGDYSRGATLVLLPRLIGGAAALDLRRRPASWQHIAAHTDLLVTFGGLRRSNTWVAPGGHSRHLGSALARAAARTTEVVSLSAWRDDAWDGLGAEWVGVLPGTDTAVTLALIHVLVVEGLADDEFLARCAGGADVVRAHVSGRDDGTPKTPEWASGSAGRPRR